MPPTKSLFAAIHHSYTSETEAFGLYQEAEEDGAS
jgi:hypothetical protein